jgi:deazaflavin-dependent oxidoreductase (nitroreductase family)
LQHSDEQYLYLTTTGWKSGNPHEIEIWFVAHGDCYYMMSEGGDHAHWVQNIQRQPAVKFRLAAQVYDATARIVDQAAESDLAQAVSGLMNSKYAWSGGWMVELRPQA